MTGRARLSIQVKPKLKHRTRIASQTKPPKIDRRRRALSPALDHLDRRGLKDAFAYAQSIGRAPTCTIDFHPCHMDAYPAGDLSIWFKDELRNRITTWLRRRHIGWYAIW